MPKKVEIDKKSKKLRRQFKAIPAAFSGKKLIKIASFYKIKLQTMHIWSNIFYPNQLNKSEQKGISVVE